MNRYTLYCTLAQTRRALELGAPIKYAKVADTINGNSIRIPEENGEFYLVPTVEQMIGFLRSKGMKFYFNDLTTFWQVVYDINIIRQGCSYNSELKAIDAALEYLENIKQ